MGHRIAFAVISGLIAFFHRTDLAGLLFFLVFLADLGWLCVDLQRWAKLR